MGSPSLRPGAFGPPPVPTADDVRLFAGIRRSTRLQRSQGRQAAAAPALEQTVEVTVGVAGQAAFGLAAGLACTPAVTDPQPSTIWL